MRYQLSILSEPVDMSETNRCNYIEVNMKTRTGIINCVQLNFIAHSRPILQRGELSQKYKELTN